MHLFLEQLKFFSMCKTYVFGVDVNKKRIEKKSKKEEQMEEGYSSTDGRIEPQIRSALPPRAAQVLQDR